MLKDLCERCHSERSEESRSGNKALARFLAQFTLNGQDEIPRFARNDSEGLGMTSAGGPTQKFGQSGLALTRKIGISLSCRTLVMVVPWIRSSINLCPWAAMAMRSQRSPRAVFR